MTAIRLPPAVAVLAAFAALALPRAANALEPGSVNPHLPGVTEGIPVGALPPPGFYFSNDLAYISARFQTGPNAGYYPRATAAEICDYYQRVLDEHLLPSGQVRFYGMADYSDAGPG